MVTVPWSREGVQESPPVVSSWREQIPAAGLREYWYPALPVKKVGRRKPVGVRLLAEDLVFFRDRGGKIVALKDRCAHRGGRLSNGICHFPGTVTCPYHGWTYDAGGKCVAAFVEGPESHIPRTNVQVAAKRVQELHGIVWVWVGDGAPVPLEEDVPEEFLDPETTIFTDIRHWPVNWRPLIENAIDGHAPYVHRNSVLGILYGLGALGQRLTPTLTREGRGISLLKGPLPPYQQDYFGLGRFPKHYLRKYWIRLFYLARWRKIPPAKMYTQEIVLPGITRITYPRHVYIRWGVPVDEGSVRNFYWHAARGSRAQKLWFAVCYFLFRRWAMNVNFSEQDRKIVGAQDYGAPEKHSWTDAVVIQWRKLVLQGYHVDRVKRTRQSEQEKRGANRWTPLTVP